ncbi:cytosolic carboxypeptidase Nna1 isoform X10 [Eurosta solidaginis]|uniref:cytosolic carboxypeptidase Nna1 isoform X10 n=1 Tax=Eurosta solidaginis TaxID=178769 RepID=UPI003531075C
MVVFNYNPVSAVNYTTNKSKLRKSSSDSDISSSESRGSSPERSANDHHKLKNPFTKLLARLERRSSSNSNDDVDDDEDNDKNNNMYEIDNRNVNEVEEKHVGVPFQKSCNGDNIDDVWANKSPEYEPATPTYIKSQFGKNVTAIKRKSKPPEISPEDAPLPDLPTRPIAPVKLFESKSDALSTTSAELDLNVKNSSSSSSKRNFSSSSVSSEFYLEQNFDNAEDDNKTLRETVTATNMDLHKKDLKKTDEQNLKSIEKQPIEILATNQKFKATSLSSNTSQIKEAYNDSQYDLIKNINPYNYQNREIEISNSDSQYEIQFSRSAVGGSKILMNCHPYNPDEYDGLEFESRFESGNLAKAVRITQTYYQLYLRSDLYTSRSKQWFYFRVRKTRKNVIYRLSIVNLVKSDSLYNDGMRPLMYSTTKANQAGEGWRRCGTNIAYYRNDDETPSEEEDENSSYTLTFNIEFEHDHDTVYFAHSYPYTYSDLQDYLMNIQKDPVKSKICKLRLLCRSLAGNNVYYLTVTAPVTDEEAMKKKKAIVVSARVHPSETPASWMMKGLMDFITGDTLAAKRLRHRFIFKLIPMLNPDGVIVGNTRNSLTGKDLNRQYRTVIRETYPSIWYTKAMVKRLIDEYKVVLYCDMHAHSRKHNIFVYGCENKRNPEKKLTEQVFPLMLHKNVADKFSFESCKFKVQRSKEGTGRIVVWMLGITNSYTIEASFGGSSLGSRKGTHFHTADYEHMGRAFCETLLDYGDDTPNKHRKPRTRRSHSHRKRSDTRIALDLPTTDPSADLIFSTDEEPNTRDDDNYLPQYCTVPRARRLLQSELQRRYIEEIGDSVMGRERTIMPPELIITSPSKGTSITIRPRVAQSKILPDPLSALEFPVPFQPARRTNSWNNLINGTLKPLCMMRQNSRAPNSYIANERKLDELDLKLSLKKKFWAGVKAEECREATGYQRSLSWNPQQRCQHQSGQQKQIAYERINKSTCEKFDQKSLRKVNREIFLNACSQLIHWQNDQNNSGKSMTTNGHNTSPTIARKIGIHIEALTLGMPEIIQDERTFRTFRNVSQVTNAHKAPTKGDSGILEYKSKRRSNALTKISDTSQLITRLAKAKSKAHNSLNQPTITRNSGISIHKHVGLLSTTSKGHVPGSNRFKTGGYVVTAVQQSSTKKVNKQHHNSKSQLSIGACTGGTCKKDQKNNCVGGTMLSKTNLSIKSTLSSNTFVRKVKAKLTKKKSSQPRGNHSNMTSNNRNLVNVNDIITNKSINGLSLPRII